jgi:acyl-CoA reductase-like NAD-dependent aldehyde dehydrogenase
MAAPTVNQIQSTAALLRATASAEFAHTKQSDIVQTISEFADYCRAERGRFLTEARKICDPFPFCMVELSLHALLDSLSTEALWRLIDSENVREKTGYPVIGHIIAGNTPLVAWTSMIRALLIRSASLVKLPSGAPAVWGRLFAETLREVAPSLAGNCIALLEWPGGTAALDSAFSNSVDMLVVYGSDRTIDTFRTLRAGKPMLSYGHRVSIGLVLQEVDLEAAAQGFATDILLYDQSGCLSPHAIYVEGDWDRTTIFGRELAAALQERVKQLPLPRRDISAAHKVRTARSLSRMEEGIEVWEDTTDLRWSIFARKSIEFSLSPTHGVVSVHCLPSIDFLQSAFLGICKSDLLQGCAVAIKPEVTIPAAVVSVLRSLGVSYLCQPGRLQLPSLSWREDDHDVLKSLQSSYSRESNVF